MQALYGYIGALVAIILAALGVYVQGRKAGHNASEAKHKDEKVQEQEATLSIRKEVDDIIKEAQRSANAQSVTSIRDRLKSNSVRKPADKT